MIFFWFAARYQPKVAKIQKVLGISNYYRAKLLKNVLIKKGSPLAMLYEFFYSNCLIFILKMILKVSLLSMI